MGITRIALLLCTLLLAFCLVLSIGALTSLKGELDETKAIRTEAQAALEQLNAFIKESTVTDSTETADPDSEPVDILYDAFCMRESGGKIAIYTTDGYLVRQLDVSVDTLPEADRNALREGICVSSWKELLALIQDFTG